MTREQKLVNIAMSTYSKGCGFTLEQWLTARDLFSKHKAEILSKINYKPWTGFSS